MLGGRTLFVAWLSGVARDMIRSAQFFPPRCRSQGVEGLYVCALT